MFCSLPVAKFPVNLGNIIQCRTRESIQESVLLSVGLTVEVMLTSVTLSLSSEFVIKLQILLCTFI